MKVGESEKPLIPFFNLLQRESRQPLQTEILHGERSNHTAIYDGAPEASFTVVAGAGQIAHKTPGERIACAGRIEDLLKRVGGGSEDRGIRELQHPVFAPLDQHYFRTHLEYGASSADDVVLPA